MASHAPPTKATVATNHSARTALARHHARRVAACARRRNEEWTIRACRATTSWQPAAAASLAARPHPLPSASRLAARVLASRRWLNHAPPPALPLEPGACGGLATGRPPPGGLERARTRTPALPTEADTLRARQAVPPSPPEVGGGGLLCAAGDATGDGSSRRPLATAAGFAGQWPSLSAWPGGGQRRRGAAGWRGTPPAGAAPRCVR